MTTTSKVLTGLILSATLSSGLYASCDMKENKQGMQNQKSKYIQGSHSKRMSKNPIFSLVKKLDLRDEQKTQIRTIMSESKKQKESINSAFTKTSFDKAKFIEIMSEKRENMIKSKADTIEKVYAVLDNKQKEQFKTLLELKMNKMSHKGMSFDKNSNGRG